MATHLWSSDLGDMPSNFLPNDTATRAGSSQSGVKEAGNLFAAIGASLAPGTINSLRVVTFFPLPAGLFDIAGRMLDINCNGGFATNGNTKTISLIIGSVLPVIGAVAPAGTTIATTGAVITNGGGWTLNAQIAKYGAPGSNTQAAVHSAAQCGSVVQALTAPSALTLNENAINYVTLAINNVSVLTDSYLSLMQAQWNN